MRRYALSLLLVAACGPAPSPATPTAPLPPIVTPPPPQPTEPTEAIEKSVHVALGVPRDGDPSDDYLMDKAQYVVDYNARLNGPNWVAWHLERGDLGRAPRSPGFRPDDTLPQGFYVVKDHDYTGSGYDRGHLCPSADRTASPALNATTFVMTNVHPQLHELNAGPWEKLEEHERELARSGRDLFIVAGGVFEKEPKRIGREPDPSHRVAVPRASYKIIVVLDHGQGAESVRPDTEVIAVVMPNTREVKDHAWSEYAVSIREIERTTGYDFLGRVPRGVQDVVETKGPARVALR